MQFAKLLAEIKYSHNKAKKFYSHFNDVTAPHVYKLELAK